MSTSPWLVAIDRQQIESADVSATVEAFTHFASDRKTAMSMLGRVGFAVSGYDNDRRELWQVPEVRLFFAHLRRRVPHMLFFLSPERKATKLWFLLCCELRYQNGIAAIDNESAAAFLMEGFQANNMFCESMGIDPQSSELIDLSFRITSALTGAR